MMETSMTSLPSPEECRCLIIVAFVQNLITRLGNFLVLHIYILMVPLEGVRGEGEDFQKFRRIKDVSIVHKSKVVKFEKMSRRSKGEE